MCIMSHADYTITLPFCRPDPVRTVHISHPFCSRLDPLCYWRQTMVIQSFYLRFAGGERKVEKGAAAPLGEFTHQCRYRDGSPHTTSRLPIDQRFRVIRQRAPAGMLAIIAGLAHSVVNLIGLAAWHHCHLSSSPNGRIV